MDSATQLQSHDRCTRKAFLEKSWERNALHPDDILRLAVERGLESEDEDPGQSAGDHVMTLFAERPVLTPQKDLYSLGIHLASLADLITWVIRGQGGPWERPVDVKVGKEPWESSCFLSASGTRLRRVILASRWSPERALGELHSWRSLAETCVYGIPLTEVVCVIGQNRDGRHHSPWTKGWVHPVNGSLRMQKRDGKDFDGKWKPVFRESTEFSREHWLDAMSSDGVLGDCLFEVTVDVPEAQAKSNIGHLAQRKLAEIRELKVIPDPRPSVCDWPTPCAFASACWSFSLPSEETGFLKRQPDGQ